ncbi:hypothetical protein ACJZ2D_017050 [Fusarium nematophilum]
MESPHMSDETFDDVVCFHMHLTDLRDRPYINKDNDEEDKEGYEEDGKRKSARRLLTKIDAQLPEERPQKTSLNIANCARDLRDRSKWQRFASDGARSDEDGDVYVEDDDYEGDSRARR